MSVTRLEASSRTDRRVDETVPAHWAAGPAAVTADVSAAVPVGAAPALRVRQRALQWGYLVAWFGLLFVVSPFLLRPEDWREKLWLSAAFLCLVVYGHLSTYTAVEAHGVTLGRWLRRTTIPWSSVTGVEVTGRWIRRVYVVCADGGTVLPAPTSGPLNWDRRFRARAGAVEVAVRQAAGRVAAATAAGAAVGAAATGEAAVGEAAAGAAAKASLLPEADGPAPIPRPRTPAE